MISFFYYLDVILMTTFFVHIGIIQWDSFWNYGLQYVHNEIDWHEKYIKL